MTEREIALLVRIAVALERQVGQHDEAVQRNMELRDESIQRHERERDEELAETHAAYERLIAQMTEAVAQNAQRLALDQQAASGAVGQPPSHTDGPRA